MKKVISKLFIRPMLSKNIYNVLKLVNSNGHTHEVSFGRTMQLLRENRATNNKSVPGKVGLK